MDADPKSVASILVVDDTPKNLQVVVSILKEYPYKIYVATSGEQALTTAHDVLPDLVLLDVVMPGMDGYATCKSLKDSARTKGIPVIFLSAKSDADDVVRGLELGAVDYIGKPFNKVELVTRVETHLAIKLAEDQLREANEKISLQNQALAEQNKLVGEKVRERTLELVEANEKLNEQIKERKAAEEMTNRLAAAVEQTAEALVIMDTNDAIQYVNPAFERTTGYSKKEVLGLGHEVLIESTAMGDPYKDQLETSSQGDVWQGRHQSSRKDGSLLEMDTTVSPVFDIDDQVVNYIWIQHDVTDQVEMQERLQKTQKLEALGTLAGGIAHDFNNILTGIIGFSELAIEMPDRPGEQQEHIQGILKAGNRAKDLVRRILTFSRDTKQEKSEINLAEVLHEGMKLMRPLIPGSLKIELDIDEDIPPVYANATQMTQVIMNLCTNAEHAMRPGAGTLGVGLDRVEILPEQVQHDSEFRAGPYARLSVSDSGLGMDAETQQRIFEPFFTTKEIGVGTGMGLAVVHGIVADHKGVIRVTSELGTGTTFCMYVPIDLHTPPENTIAQVPASLPLGKGESILFVDDEESICLIVERMLSLHGYCVDSASDARKAIEAFGSRPGGYDIVITDYNMPGMNGIQLAERLLSINSTVPIVLYSGSITKQGEQDAKVAGIMRFMAKPISKQELLEAIYCCLETKPR